MQKNDVNAAHILVCFFQSSSSCQFLVYCRQKNWRFGPPFPRKTVQKWLLYWYQSKVHMMLYLLTMGRPGVRRLGTHMKRKRQFYEQRWKSFYHSFMCFSLTWRISDVQKLHHCNLRHLAASLQKTASDRSNLVSRYVLLKLGGSPDVNAPFAPLAHIGWLHYPTSNTREFLI